MNKGLTGLEQHEGEKTKKYFWLSYPFTVIYIRNDIDIWTVVVK